MACLLEADGVPPWFLPLPVGCVMSLPAGLNDMHGSPKSMYLEEGLCSGGEQIEAGSTLVTQPWMHAPEFVVPHR